MRTATTRHIPTAARLALGFTFFICGLNGFLNFLPQPSTPVPDGALAFAGALMKTGYMFPLIAGTQALAGALLLSGVFVPLAVVLLAPVLVNILAFHAFLAPSGLGLAVVFCALEALLAWTHRGAFRPLFAVSVRAGTVPLAGVLLRRNHVQRHESLQRVRG